MNQRHYSEQPNIVVDMRSLLPPARDQGARPLCLAFSTSDAHAKFHGLNQLLSVEYLAHYAYELESSKDYSRGLSPDSVATALRDKGQPYEKDWPYQSNLVVPASPPKGLTPIYNGNYRDYDLSISELTALLDAAEAVVLVVEITGQFFQPLIAPYVIDDVSAAVGLHAMLVVGYGQYPDGEKLILVRNSWGERWGLSGYAWLTSAFVTAKTITCMRLT